MTGEPMHAASNTEMAPYVPATDYMSSEPLCFVVSYVQPVTQHYESRTVRKAPLQSQYESCFTLTEAVKMCLIAYDIYLLHVNEFVCLKQYTNLSGFCCFRCTECIV